MRYTDGMQFYEVEIVWWQAIFLACYQKNTWRNEVKTKTETTNWLSINIEQLESIRVCRIHHEWSAELKMQNMMNVLHIQNEQEVW